MKLQFLRTKETTNREISRALPMDLGRVCISVIATNCINPRPYCVLASTAAISWPGQSGALRVSAICRCLS